MADEKKEIADKVICGINENFLDQPIPRYELEQAGFNGCGDIMAKTIGYVQHRFIRVAKDMYVYDGQTFLDRP